MTEQIYFQTLKPHSQYLNSQTESAWSAILLILISIIIMHCYVSFKQVHISSSCNQNTSGTPWIYLSLRTAEVVVVVIVVIIIIIPPLSLL